MQVKIVIPDELYEKIKIEADKNFRTATQEINYRLTNSFTTQPQPQPQPYEIPGVPFPEIPSIITSTTQIQPQSYQHVNTTATTTSTPISHTHADITPPGVQPAASQPTTTLQITPDPDAGSINIPYVDVASIKDYTKPQSEQKSHKNNSAPMPVLTDLEIEQVDNEWDAEGNEYSTEDFMIDLTHLEAKMREDLPANQDPTRDPDYIALKNYFIKHDLRERFRSLLSDPSRFYPEEGVYNQPQIKYAQCAFRNEKIDHDYIVALLSGTGADYRHKHHMSLYVDEL